MKYCTECGSGLPEGAKFCPECGTRAATAAPTEAPPSAPQVQLPEGLRTKFEAARAELRGDRREVAVLFADMQGFTALSGTMDPEEVTLLMNPLLKRLADAVYHYEGYVDKFMGDGVMALFGAPLAHENDPQRAVHAGLSMVSVIEAHNADSDIKLALRVGINLGDVVAAQLGSQMRLQYTVLGDTVNVASRLEGAADPNTVLVSEKVFRRVARNFSAEEVTGLALKGVTGPVNAYRITGFIDHDTVSEIAASPFVGRDSEVATIHHFLDRAWRSEADALLVEAEAGTGKSRLVQEALARCEVEHQRIEIAFSQIRLPGERTPPTEIFRRLLPDDDAETRALELLGDAADEHRAGVESLVRDAAGRPEEGDPESARRNRWFAIAALLEAAARERPLVLVIEDVHWANEGAQEFLAFLLPTFATRPVAALVTSRPAATQAWVPEGVGRLRVEPLDARTAEALLGDSLDDLAPEDRRDLIERSAGNPLFLEELVRAVGEAGRRDGRATSVPGTLQGLIMSRIDRLDPAHQTLLQMAAVLGSRFSKTLLARMYALESHRVSFEDALDSLMREDFFDVDPDDLLRFRHGLMQEVTYQGLLGRMRSVLHESAAQIGSDYFGEDVEAEATFFAHHLWHAGQSDRAAPYLWIAGRDAADDFDLPLAEKYLRRAAETIYEQPEVLPDDETRAGFAETYGRVLLHRGDLDTAETWFDRLEELGSTTDRHAWAARAIEQRGRVAWYRGQLDAALALFERGLEVVPDREELLVADLRNGLGIVFYYRGRVDDAFEQHREALRLREQHDDHSGAARSHLNIGNVMLDLLGDLSGAEEHHRQALALADSVGDRQLKYIALNNLGRVAMERGAWTAAIETLQEAEHLLEDIGWTFARYVTLQNRVCCEIALGRIDDALRHLEICRRGDEVLEPVNRVNTRFSLFDAYLQALDDARAAAALDEARELIETLGVDEQRAELLLREGRLAAARGVWEDAAAAFEKARDVAREGNQTAAASLAEAHRCRALVRGGASEVELCTADAQGNRSLENVIAFLNIEAGVAQTPTESCARALKEISAAAAELGEIALERAAAERLAELWRSLGDRRREQIAVGRAVRALRALEANLPADARSTFLDHPRNAALLSRSASTP